MTTQPSKPRLKFWGRLWYCGQKYGSGLCGVVGVGYTPAQAYEDWKKGGAR